MKKILGISLIFIILIISLYEFIKPREQKEFRLYGNVDIRQVNTSFRVAGRLQNMNFEEGDIVHKGDILATLDNEPFINAQNQAKAKVLQASAALVNAELINSRKQALCKTKNASQQDCDTSLANMQIASADLEYAKASLDVANTSFNDTILKAPSDGVILNRIAEPGTLLSSGVPVYSISLKNKMWARAYVKETDLGRFVIGSKVKIYTDSTDKTYNGHIGFVSSVAEFTPKNIETASLRTDLVYRIRIIIENADDFLKQGMPVTIELE